MHGSTQLLLDLSTDFGFGSTEICFCLKVKIEKGVGGFQYWNSMVWQQMTDFSIRIVSKRFASKKYLETIFSVIDMKLYKMNSLVGMSMHLIRLYYNALTNYII